MDLTVFIANHFLSEVQTKMYVCIDLYSAVIYSPLYSVALYRVSSLYRLVQNSESSDFSCSG